MEQRPWRLTAVFSTRTSWNREANALAQALDKRRSAGGAFLDLTIANPTACGIEYPVKEIAAELQQGARQPYQPVPAGIPAAREAVRTYYRAAGQDVPIDRILLTASTSEGYLHTLTAICDAGDDVLVPQPSYPLFDYLCHIASVRPVPYSLVYDGRWSIDLSGLLTARTEKTRAVIVVSPHNPTGHVSTPEEMDCLAEFCLEQRLALVVDEVFRDYPLGASAESRPSTATEERCLTITLNGISKTLGLPHFKVGWLAVSGPERLRQEALARLEILADTFLSVNTPVQHALPALFEVCATVRTSIRSRLLQNLSELETAASPPSPLTLLAPEAGWNAVLRVPRMGTDEESALQLLERHGVYAHPGHFYDFADNGHVVCSLLTRPDELREALRRMTDFWF